MQINKNDSSKDKDDDKRLSSTGLTGPPTDPQGRRAMEGTEFRSVAINAGMAAVRSIGRDIPYTSFAVMPPFLTPDELTQKMGALDKKQMETTPTVRRAQSFTKDPKKLLPADYPIPLLEPSFVAPTKFSWKEPDLRPIPNYYPMERSNCIVNLSEHSVKDITQNIAECLRLLSVHAHYFDKPAAAALLTPEHVEIYLTLWKAPNNNQVQVEVQRRRGDSITFHRYCRHILDAATGDFDASEVRTSHTYNLQYLKAAEKFLRFELSKTITPEEESRAALEIAHSLLTKDRIDARKLGIESLCILTDPTKTNVPTTIMASRAVLLGGEDPVSHDIHTMILNLIQKRCMSENDDDVLEGMSMESDSDDEDFFPSDDEPDSTRPPEYNDVMSTMLNHALTILCNAVQVLAAFESEDYTPESTASARPSFEHLVDHFLHEAYMVTDTDLIFSLLHQIQRAISKPHNACLAAKSLLCIVTHSSVARERAVKSNAPAIVARAYDVGLAYHANLEHECGLLLPALFMKH